MVDRTDQSETGRPIHTRSPVSSTAHVDPIGRTTVAICTKGRSECVAEAVGSILIDPNEDVELIIVDQNEDGRVVAALASYAADPRLKHVRVQFTGAGRARNTALELASTPVVCFTDDDCIVPPGWADTMSQLMLERPQVSLVFGSVLARRTADDHLGYTPDFIIEREVELATWGLNARVDHLGIGACMAVRRSDVLAIGGFDPMMGPGSLFPSADDRELAIRLLLAHRRVLMTPAGVVEHGGFRLNGDAARAHSKRDHLALGAMLGKLTDAGAGRALTHLFLFIAATSVGIIRASARNRRLQGFGKLKWTVLGFRDGRRQPRLRHQPIFVDDLAASTN